jgi:type III restriction enzyme
MAVQQESRSAVPRRRRNYEVGDDDLLNEEVAQVLGVPFEVIPFKANKAGPAQVKDKRHHVHPIPSKSEFEIRFPRVEGYTQRVRNRVTVDCPAAPARHLQPGRIPPEVEVKALSVTNQGRMTLTGPGRVDEVKLNEFRARHRLQELVFDMARALTIEMCRDGDGVPAHAPIIQRYLDDKVLVYPPAHIKDVFLSPYYGWLIERLREAIRPDTSQGEAAEVPRYEKSRGPGSTAEVDYWTSKEVREVRRCHLNYVVADTAKWEQSAAYYIDTHPAVAAFVKNAGLGFAVLAAWVVRAAHWPPCASASTQPRPPTLICCAATLTCPARPTTTRGTARRWSSKAFSARR